MTASVLASAGRCFRTPRYRVLVVDDDEDGAVAVGELLTWIGHEVHLSHDGHGALRVVDNVRPDLVILDLGLPDLDGYQLARELRVRFGRELMLVALSGWSRPGDLARSSAAGFDRHLVKPTSLAELREILTEVLNGRGRDEPR